MKILSFSPKVSIYLCHIIRIWLCCLPALAFSQSNVIDRLVIPGYPVPVNTARNLTLALMFGLGMGFGISLVLEYADNTIRSQEEVTTHLKIPVMGVVPDFKMAG